VWRNFMSLCTAGTVVQAEPRLLEPARVHRLVIDILWRFIRRGPGHGSNVSAFLFKQLVGYCSAFSAALLDALLDALLCCIHMRGWETAGRICASSLLSCIADHAATYLSSGHFVLPSACNWQLVSRHGHQY
jgi:hypothetical protein